MSNFKCSNCDYSSRYKRNLERHRSTQHDRVKIPENNESAEYTCSKCKYKTYTEFGLKVHIASAHPKDCQFKCDKCEYSTDLESSLKLHRQQKHILLIITATNEFITGPIARLLDINNLIAVELMIA